MPKINSLQGQVLDEQNHGASGKTVRIKCGADIICAKTTDGQGYFIENGIANQYIDQIPDQYSIMVDGRPQQQYQPKPPLQSKDAQHSIDPNGNDVYVFPIRMFWDSSSRLMGLSREERTYQCCQCDEDVTHLVERACKNRHVYPSVSGITNASFKHLDRKEVTTVLVQCSKGHLCEFDCSEE